MSNKLIDLDKFVNFFSVDPHYFERTWLLIPDNSDRPYALLRKLLEKTGMAATGKVTMSSRERVALIHYYQNTVVMTTLHYPDEVTEPLRFAVLRDLPEPAKEEIDLMTKIVDKLTVDYDLSVFHDGYKERIGAMIEAKMKGQVAEVKEKEPKKPVAKSMMEALRKTAESLK